MLRIALAGISAGPLLASIHRGQLFELVAVIGENSDADLFHVPIVPSPEDAEFDYLFTSDRRIAGEPHHTFVIDTGDVLGAFFDGATETRTTMTLLSGPLFLASSPFPVPPIIENARQRGDAELIEQYAELHRKWMIEASYGAMLQKAVEFLAAGDIRIVGDVVWIDGVPGPCRMGDAPANCREQEKSGIPVSCPYITT